MFLKEFAITRYGPLSSGAIKRPGLFTLYHAPNEEGKTLTIDALLKMMFSSRELKPFDGVKRVEETPEGYLVATSDGKELKLPEAGSLASLFDISPLEFRNIFLIRDSDLALTGEEEFYRGVTGRLTGMRTEEIKSIKENLQELGGITAGGDFLNTAPNKLKDRYIKAKKILTEIEALLEELEAEGFSRFEDKLALLEEQRSETETLLESYAAAYNRELYEKGREALVKLRMALKGLSSLEKYNRDDYEAWQRAESNLNYLNDETKGLEKECGDRNQQLRAALQKRDQKRQEFKGLELTFGLVKERIEPVLEEYNHLSGAGRKEAVFLKSPFVKKTAALSTLAFIIALAGAAVRSDWWLLPVLFGSLLLTLSYGLLRFRVTRRKADLARLEAAICSEAERLDLPAGDLQAVRAAAGRLNRALELGADSLEEAEKEVWWLEREAGRLGEEIKSREEKTRLEEGIISGIRIPAGVETLAQYYNRLEEKQVLGGEIETQKSVLQSHFGAAEGFAGPEKILSYWTEQTQKLEKFARKAANLPYDQDAVDELSREREQVEGEIKQIEEKIARSGDQLRDLEKEINKLLLQEEETYLPCQATVDLEASRQKVGHWIEKRERDRKKAQIALDIFNRIAAQEEQKVSVLFGPGKPVSTYFGTITGGRYREVLFDSVQNRVKVSPVDGPVLEAGRLSGGAYDQLYFSIRLALAESLLQGKKGFFILDDPFIKADAGRLKIMLGMLGAICREGWQVIYFSAKDEVKAALQEEIDAGRVQAGMISL